MPHSQVRYLYPPLEELPILEFEPSGNRYFVLQWTKPTDTTVIGPYGTRKRIYFMKVEMIQYEYSDTTGRLGVYYAFKEEYPLVKKWLKDPWGNWFLGFGMEDWKQVEFRKLLPGELTKLEAEIPGLVSSKRKHESKRLLQHFRDENYHRMAEEMFVMGEATSPMNPVIEPDHRRVSLIK